MRSVPATRTPVPVPSPVAYWASAALGFPGVRVVWYISVSKLARSRLNPVVLTLARLFEIVFIFWSSASRPERAICKAEVIVVS